MGWVSLENDDTLSVYERNMRNALNFPFLVCNALFGLNVVLNAGPSLGSDVLLEFV